MADRHEFSPSVKLVLAQRAGYRCSSPRCRAMTVFPHSNDARRTITGVAAHICAAAPGGPRYDRTQTPEQRAAISNGIWLCHTCSDLVDKDPDRFPAELLRQWKSAHEEWLAGDNVVPRLPKVRIATLRGLSLTGAGPQVVDSRMVAELREHEFEIATGSGHAIQQLVLRVQFPEAFVEAQWLERPVGIAAEIEEERPRMVVRISGRGHAEQHGQPLPTYNSRITLQELIPERPVKLLVRTIPSIANIAGGFPPEFSAGGSHFHFIQGGFTYREREHTFERDFVYPIEKVGDRQYSAGSAAEVDAHTLFVTQFHGQPTTLTVGTPSKKLLKSNGVQCWVL